MKKQIKIGLALGGGGARGLAHIGVLKALKEAGIKIDMIAGTSMGAFIGACYSIGMEVDKMETEARSFTKRKAMRELVDLALPKYSIIKGKKIFNYIDDFLDHKGFSDTKIPLRVIATNLSNGEGAAISKGNLARAIEASICVPGIFPPVKIGSDYYVDGGVADPTPIDQVIKMGADIVIGVDLVYKRSVIREDLNLVSTLLQSYEVIRNKSVNLCQNEKKRKIIIIQPDLNGNSIANSFKFFDIHEFIEAGERAAKKAIPNIKRKIKSLS